MTVNFQDKKSELFQALREIDFYVEQDAWTDDHGTVTSNRIFDLTPAEAAEMGLDESLVGLWMLKGVEWSGNEGTNYCYCDGCHRVEPYYMTITKYRKVPE